MPGPTGMQPSKLKKPVPEIGAQDVPESGSFGKALSVSPGSAELVDAGREPQGAPAAAPAADPYDVTDFEKNVFNYTPPPPTPVISGGSPVSEALDAASGASDFSKTATGSYGNFDPEIAALADSTGIDSKPINGAVSHYPDGTPNKFFGKTVGAKINGFGLKVSPSGGVDIFDSETKKWRGISPDEQRFFKSLYDAKSNIYGDTLGAAVGLIPGGKAATVIGSAGVSAARIAGAGASPLIGKYVSSKINANDPVDYVLRKAGGISDENFIAPQKDMDTLWSMGLNAITAGLFEGLGGISSISMDKASTRAKAIEAAMPSVGQASKIQKASKALGLPGLTSAEAASGDAALQLLSTSIPELAPLSTVQQEKFLSGVSSPEQAAVFARMNQGRAQKVADAISADIRTITGESYSKAIPQMEISGPSRFNAESGMIEPDVGGGTIFDSIKSKSFDRLDKIRGKVRELGLDKQYVDVSPIINNADAVAGPLLPKGVQYRKDGSKYSYFNSDGSVNWTQVLQDKSFANSASLKDVFNKVSLVKSLSSRQGGGFDQNQSYAYGQDVFSGSKTYPTSQSQVIGGLKDVPSMTGKFTIESDYSPMKRTSAGQRFEPTNQSDMFGYNQVQDSLPGKTVGIGVKNFPIDAGSSKAGPRSGGLTLAQIMALTDNLQATAYDDRVPAGPVKSALQAMAASSRKLEGEAVAEAARNNGAPYLADAYEKANADASTKIGAAQRLNSVVSSNLDRVGPAVFERGSNYVKDAMSVLDQSQRQDFVRAVFDAASFNVDSSGEIGTKFDPRQMKNYLYGGQGSGRTESTIALLGKENAVKFRAMLEYAERISDVPGPADYGNDLNLAGKVISTAKTLKYDKARTLFDWVKGYFETKPDLDIMSKSVDDVIIDLEAKYRVGLKKQAARNAMVQKARLVPGLYKAAKIGYNSAVVSGEEDKQEKKK